MMIKIHICEINLKYSSIVTLTTSLMRLQMRRFILNFSGEYKIFVKTSEDKIFVSDHTDITSVGICGPWLCSDSPPRSLTPPTFCCGQRGRR